MEIRDLPVEPMPGADEAVLMGTPALDALFAAIEQAGGRFDAIGLDLLATNLSAFGWAPFG